MTDQADFDALQQTLAEQWKLIGSMNQLQQTMVVVPSISIDLDAPSGVLQAYEERFLFLLLLLRKPRARMIYVTSKPILPEIIDYYLGLLPGVVASHARKRLHPLAVLDGSTAPLTQKILDRPRMLARIKGLIGDPSNAHLVPYNTTDLEKELASRLGIPMYGADPKYFPLGTKTGCRRLFAEEGVKHPAGREDLWNLEQLVEAVQSIRKERDCNSVLVKLNEGVSGEGNALVDLSGLPAAGATEEATEIKKRLQTMKLESPSLTVDDYFAKLADRGGVVEERISGREFRSPSVQLRATPLGDVELLSTHDQLLGGPSGQSFLGCKFPADPGYAAAITRDAKKVGERLAREGVLGRFALDFVVARDDEGDWKAYAIEINLRKGGTTHPYLTLEFLTDGRYDAENAVFLSRSGKPKFYVATDHLESPLFKALTPDDLFDFVVRQELHFTQATQTGVVFHMMSAMTEFGRLGFTAVGDSPEEAAALYERTTRELEKEAAAAPPGVGPLLASQELAR